MSSSKDLSRETAAYVDAGMSWNCPNCGRPNKNTSNFCAGCGSPRPAVNMQNTMHGGFEAYTMPGAIEYDAATKNSGSAAVKILAGILAALLLVAAIGFAVWHFFLRDRMPDEQIPAQEGSGQIADNENGNEAAGVQAAETADPNYNPNAADPSQGSITAPPDNSTAATTDNSKFKTGNTYTVVVGDGVIVRRAPDKVDGNELKYSELNPAYQSQADSSNGTSAIALLKHGAKVTCLEMSGNWMRIQDNAWVCTYFDGETLIE